LTTWRESDGLGKLVDRLLDNYDLESLSYRRDNTEEGKHKRKTNIQQCLRKVADGHFTAAVKVLGSSGVAPYNEATLKVLGKNHPHMPPPSTPTTMFTEAPLSVESDIVLKCIQ
jgi:hypothetical protein